MTDTHLATCPACRQTIACDDHTMCEGCGADMHEACNVPSNHPRIDVWCGVCDYGRDMRKVYDGPFPGMTHRVLEPYRQPDNAPKCRCGNVASLYQVDNFVLYGYRCVICDDEIFWAENENDARERFVRRRSSPPSEGAYEAPKLEPYQIGALDQDQLVIEAWSRASKDGSTPAQVDQCIADAEDRAIMSERWVITVEGLQELCTLDDTDITDAAFRKRWREIRARVNKPE